MLPVQSLTNYRQYPIGKQHRYHLPKSLIVPLLALFLRLASGPTANLSYLVLAAWALFGPRQAIQALFMSWLFTMFNPGLASEASLGAIGRYAVIFGAMASVLLGYFSKNQLTIKKHIVATLLIGLFLIIHSLLVSPIPDVSLLKSISFLIAFTSLLAAWGALNPDERMQTEMFVFGGMIAVALVSLPFISGGVGYLRNGTGFQGILNHPQAFGPFAALLAGWLAAQIVSNKKPPSWHFGLLILLLVMIFASEARTAGGAFVLGFGFPFLFVLVFRIHELRSILPGIRTGKFALALWVAVFGLIAFGSVFMTEISQYISKSGRSMAGSDLAGAYQESRGLLVTNMIANIRNYPISGIGFGIASFPETMTVARDAFTGLPIGASIEKGVMPVAIVEELGVPGALLLFSWIGMLIARASRAGFASLVVILTSLFVNLGENVFFSAGGQGMLVMILVTWAASPAGTARVVKKRSWIG